VWKDNLNREYTGKSAYHWLLSQRDGIVSLEKCNWIWKLPLSPNEYFFIWQVSLRQKETLIALSPLKSHLL